MCIVDFEAIALQFLGDVAHGMVVLVRWPAPDHGGHLVHHGLWQVAHGRTILYASTALGKESFVGLVVDA